MLIRNFIVFIALGSVLLAATLGGQGCATIVPPSGGFRDSLPPQLIDVRPGDSARNFSENRIVFSFQEYVDLDNTQQNVIVSPIPKVMPLISRKLNVVTVRLKDSLQDNTTYTINFGNTIKDITEGNVLKNFTYVFSTGPAIDSLELRGKVLLAETGQIDTTLTVMLHRTSRDSALIKEKPRYIAKLDGKGNFLFRFLPADTFYLYALASQGSSYTYTNPNKQLFAFADSAVIIKSGISPVTLYAYVPPAVEESSRPATSSVTGRGAGTPADRRLKVQSNLTEGKQSLLDNFVLSFEAPLKSFDSAKARLSFDSSYIPVTGYSWQLDSTKRKITLTYAWKENISYHLTLEKDFAIDSLNRQLLKTDTLDFRSRALTDYGKLAIRFRNLDVSKNPVLLLYQSDVLKGSFPLSSIDFSQGMILPGEYELRILYDQNKNGKWDPGIFFTKRKQPELVHPVQRKITVRPNWSNEFEIDINTATGPKLPDNQNGQSTPSRSNPGIRRPGAGGRL